jgi:serine/threonine-protein kinase
VLGELDLATRSVFAGRYSVVRRIASGGMGAVFEVLHIETQRRRALKVMLPELLLDRQLRERFQMEARITANVETEYIVDVFDAGVDDATGMPFLVMELLNGEDLAKVIEHHGSLAPEQVVTYLRQVGSALDKTHAAGIVHRDLKPENLFLTHREDGSPRVKILDFGISKVVSDAATGGNATRGLGTPLYMAPEQVLGQAVGPATDLYALALIAYTLLVGAPYWQSDVQRFDNPISFVVHTSKGVTDSASERAAEVGRTLPPDFDAWFRKATALDVTQRFRNAADLVAALASALSVPLPSVPGTPLRVDAPVFIARSGAAPGAETVASRTAPGTEFDRSGTLPGATRRRRVTIWLGVGASAAAIVTATLLLVRRPDGSTGAEPAATAAATSAAAPTATSVVVASANVLPEPAASVGSPVADATASATAAPASSVKAQSPTRKSTPARSPASVRAGHAPKYTRD